MRIRGLVVCGVLLTATLSGAASCSPTATTNAQILVDGQPVLVHGRAIPGSLTPLVVALHGLGSSGADFALATGLSAFADSHGFVVAYPDAHPAPDMPAPVGSPTTTPSPSPSATPTHIAAPPSVLSLDQQRTQHAAGLVEDARSPTFAQSSNRAWNAGACCGGSVADDVAYLQDVVIAVARLTHADLRRVYVIGLSNGGMMALRAICAAPTVFAAAGSVAGPYLGHACARPAWKHLHGSSDPVVPYLGGVPPGSPYLGVPAGWCVCSFPDSSTEQARFPHGSISEELVTTGTHSWPQLGDGAWNLDGNADLWSFLSHYHL